MTETKTKNTNGAMSELAKMMSKGPGVFVMQFRHDDDCPQLSGGQCNCTPDIEAMTGAKWANQP